MSQNQFFREETLLQTKKRIRNVILLTLGLLALAALLAFLFANGVSVGCVFKRLTGLQCPGCGNTRATFALLRLDLLEMLRFNLLYPLEIYYLARVYLVCSKNYVKTGRFSYRPTPDLIDVLCLALMLLWTVIRNLIPLFT